ncbi:hypothetical protein KF707_07205 [Candidatus Obscuribacterales bacterium]|nr:hypothetical protein [Candidatus Obscuribacterales bacterium]
MSKLHAVQKTKTKQVTFELFHSIDESFWKYLRYGRPDVDVATIREGFRNGDYKSVGIFKRPEFPLEEIEEELERIFYVTNHKNEEWSGEQRSTSVGDVIKYRRDYYIVAPVGFDFGWKER